MLECLAAIVAAFATVTAFGLIAEFVSAVKQYLHPQEGEATR